MQALFCASRVPAQGSKKEEAVVKNGAVVTLEYSLADDKGNAIELGSGKQVVQYTHGHNQIIKGLEKELAGMKVGAKKQIRVTPEEGYGAVNPKAVQEIPKEKVPPEGLKIGAVLTAKNSNGQIVPIMVREIKEKTVILDLNHPLAGKTLIFSVTIVEIQTASGK
jgi:FKBP-type peptidyl-prolyl cis-trans isomerase SlyD